jgi:hypothetical protein
VAAVLTLHAAASMSAARRRLSVSRRIVYRVTSGTMMVRAPAAAAVAQPDLCTMDTSMCLVPLVVARTSGQVITVRLFQDLRKWAD